MELITGRMRSEYWQRMAIGASHEEAMGHVPDCQKEAFEQELREVNAETHFWLMKWLGIICVVIAGVVTLIGYIIHG